QACIEQDVDNIPDAISTAIPGDTINIHGEEDSENPGTVYTYTEGNLNIDKELTITCNNPHETLGYPEISCIFGATVNEIFRVTHDDVTISNLVIVGPDTDNVDEDYPLDHMENKAGIRIEAGHCTVDSCRIIQCMTGIVIDSSGGTSDMGNVITNCTIGDRYIYQDNTTEEYWVDMSPDVHPGNGFGIVEIAPSWSQPELSYTNLSTNTITGCTIRSNRYYGVVLTNGSRAKLAHNIIAWNGDINCDPRNTPTPGAVVPDKTGGILSLYTSNQLSSNYNKLQSPLIMSNNIYGNLGYQVTLLSEGQVPRPVVNSPVLMSNTIGTQADMGDPDGINLIDMKNYLISCGPKPDLSPTYTPTSTPTGILSTPLPPTSTPIPPGSFSYAYHGSAPIMAWNVLSNPEKHYRTYHPMQPDTLHHTPTPPPATPTQQSTNTPTPTFTSTPTARFTMHTPTGMPTWTPAPTSPAGATPVLNYYQCDDPAWSLKNQYKSPAFIGWTVPTQGPPVFDWHLADVPTGNPLPTATGTPSPTSTPYPYSACFNNGGLLLNPGISQADMLPDENRVDIGYHTKGQVPMVENLSVTVYLGESYKVSWERPSYYYDGSGLDLSDVGGYRLYYGRYDEENDPPQIIQIGNPIELSAYETIRIVEAGSYTHIGILLYDIRGMESKINWGEVPE
ncbi:MAG TPA: right-handed parallel beta-helix repeat-containing protein, partial [bacterium]|nr:right-handed parallel beta-helix repeat-containing protein [bacterium]